MIDYLPFILIGTIPLWCALAINAGYIYEWIHNKIDWLLHHKEYEQNEKELAELIAKLVLNGWDTSNISANYANIDNLEVTYISADKIFEENKDEDSN